MLGRLLRRTVDPIVEGGLRLAARVGLRDPLRWARVEARRAAMTQAQEQYGERLATLGEAVAAREATAVREYDGLVAAALAAMRSAFLDGKGALTTLDRWLYRDEAEWLDDPDRPAAERTEVLAVLDRLNQHGGAYQSFLELLAPLIAATQHDRVRFHDLAAGHAGFALFLDGALGGRAVIEASDVHPEYLALGEARACARGAAVTFHVQDALALDELRRRGVDVITCTQALHHFRPGMIARLIGEAARAATVGACLIDGERSWLLLGGAAALGLVYGRSRAFLHDSMASARRMLYAEELALLGALAPALPADVRLESGVARSGHAYLRLQRFLRSANVP